MTNFQNIRFRWSDAWLMLAVHMAAKNGSTSLAGVIGSADAIQHAIITKAELDGGVERLKQAGLLELKSASFVLTPHAQAIADHAAKATSLIRDQEKLIEEALGASPWTPGDQPHSAVGDGEPLISDDEYATALKNYHTAIRRRRKP